MLAFEFSSTFGQGVRVSFVLRVGLQFRHGLELRRKLGPGLTLVLGGPRGTLAARPM